MKFSIQGHHNLDAYEYISNCTPDLKARWSSSKQNIRLYGIIRLRVYVYRYYIKCRDSQQRRRLISNQHSSGCVSESIEDGGAYDSTEGELCPQNSLPVVQIV
ncbi:hypothetical protein TNCV_1113541 [Trichonephila clavipes]|nr:hypothetical protein TNCV_1113541 [Trichonephila clavipes]